MELLLAFLFGTFIAGGLARRSQSVRKPSVLLGVCVVVGAMFYSVRIL